MNLFQFIHMNNIYFYFLSIAIIFYCHYVTLQYTHKVVQIKYYLVFIYNSGALGNPRRERAPPGGRWLYRERVGVMVADPVPLSSAVFQPLLLPISLRVLSVTVQHERAFLHAGKLHRTQT